MFNKTKKRIFIPICSAVLVICSIMAVAFGKTSSKPIVAEAATAFDENNIVFRIANVSDSHVGVTYSQLGGNTSRKSSAYGYEFPTMDNLERAMSYFNSAYGKAGIDAIMHCGDLTENGLASNVDSYFTVQNKYFKGTPFVFTLGNHDVYWSGCMNRSAWFDKLNEYGVYAHDTDLDIARNFADRHTVISKNGVNYHFVSVDINNYGFSSSTKESYNTLAAETKTWLKKTLNEIQKDENAFPYIFVNSHSPSKNDAYGSLHSALYENLGYLYGGNALNEATGTSVWGASQDLDDILKDYPQVILFTGHTHMGTTDERNINQTTYTQINSGSVSDYVSDSIGVFKRANTDTSGEPKYTRDQGNGMVIEVDNQGRIRIARYDFYNGSSPASGTTGRMKASLTGGGYWYLNAYSEDGSHLDSYSRKTVMAKNTAPYFEPSARATVSRASVGANISVTFPKAKDDDMVYYYKIDLIDHSTGKVVYSSLVLDEFIEYPTFANMPKTQTFTFAANQAKVKAIAGDFEVSVTPFDSFGLYGHSLVGSSITTTNGWSTTQSSQGVSIGGANAQTGHAWMSFNTYGTVATYNEKVQLDGLKIKMTTHSTDIGYVGFGFAKNFGDSPVLAKTSFNAVFWPKYNGMTAAQTRLVLARDHDYSVDASIAYKTPDCTPGNNNENKLITAYGTQNLVFNLGTCTATFTFTKIKSCWKVDIEHNGWEGNYGTVYVPSNYFENVMDADGKAYVVGQGNASDKTKSLSVEIYIDKAEETPTFSYDRTDNSYTVTGLRSEYKAVTLSQAHFLNGLSFTLSSDNYSTVNNDEWLGVVLKRHAVYGYKPDKTVADVSGLHVIIKPSWSSTNGGQTRVFINSDGGDDTYCVYKDEALTTRGFGVSTVAWVGNGTSESMSFTFTFNKISSSVWKVTISNVVGTKNWSSSQTMVGYIKAADMAKAIDDSGRTYVIAKGKSAGHKSLSEKITFVDPSYTVSFNGNGAGSGSVSPMNIRYGAAKLLNENNFVKTGYDFKGWATSAGGAVVYADNGSYEIPEGGATLYAVWQAKKYNLTFIEKGKETVKTGTYGQKYNLPELKNADGAVAIGWKTADGSLYNEGYGYPVSEDATFTLWYANISHTIGASIRLVNDADDCGIRFANQFSNVGSGVIKGYKDISDVVTSTGIIVMPKNLIGEQEFTYENYSGDSQAGRLLIDKSDFVFVDGKMETKLSIINLYAKNYNREFSSRSFIGIKYSDGSTDVHYTDFTDTNNTRSITSVATSLINSTTHRSGDGKSSYSQKLLDNIYRFIDGTLTVSESGGTYALTDNVNSSYRAKDNNSKVSLSVTGSNSGNTVTLNITVDADRFESLLGGNFRTLTFNGERYRTFTQSQNGNVVTVTFNK